MKRLLISLFLISLLTSCSPFSDEELLKHYFEMSVSDVKDIRTSYTGNETVLVCFRFQLRNGKAYNKLQQYLEKYKCFKQKDINKLSSGEKLHFTKGLSWMNPPLKDSVLYVCEKFPEKNVTWGYIFIDKKTNTVYAEFGNIYTD